MKRKNRKRKGNKVLSYLKNLKRKEKIILFTTILIITFIGIEEGLISPLRKKEENLNKEINSLKLKKVEAIENSTKEDELTNKLTKVLNKYNNLIKGFPKTEKQAALINDISIIAKESNMEIIDMSFDKGTIPLIDEDKKENGKNEADIINGNSIEDKENLKDDKEGEVLVHKGIVTVDGTFENLIYFIKRVENMKRKVNVVGVAINTLDEENNKNLECTISINFYNLNSKEKEKYDFNKGSYGKENYFK